VCQGSLNGSKVLLSFLKAPPIKRFSSLTFLTHLKNALCAYLPILSLPLSILIYQYPVGLGVMAIALPAGRSPHGYPRATKRQKPKLPYWWSCLKCRTSLLPVVLLCMNSMLLMWSKSLWLFCQST